MVTPRVTPEFDIPGVLLGRLAPPSQPARLLRRPRVEKLLAGALEHPFSVVAAPAGSGKTVALAQFAQHGGWPVAWCRLSASDDGPALVRHLAACFRPVVPLDEQAISALLANEPGDGAALAGALDLLVNNLAAQLHDETLLVLDGYEQIDDHPALRVLLDQFYVLLPLRLHLLLVSRLEPTLSGLSNARVRGELFELGQAALAFSADEAAAFFELAGYVRPDDLPSLVLACRGWPLAVRAALGGEWRLALGLREPSAGEGAAAARLDDYLEREVVAEQPEELTSLLLHGALLQQLDPQAVAAVAGVPLGEALFATMRRRQLFVEELPGGRMAFQPVFHAFLGRLARRRLPHWAHLQRRAAEWYRGHGKDGEALYHVLAAGDSASAAAALSQSAAGWLANGQAAELLAWIDRLPAGERAHPRMIELRATALHHLGQFDSALQSFQQAEAIFIQAGDLDGQVRVLGGQAEIYLDTVQAAPALALLKRALKLLPRPRSGERAVLLRLLAENWANGGRADVALLLGAAAERIGGGHVGHTIPPRILLRAGRLHEARQQLEALALLWNEEGGQKRGLSGHREPLLLLAWIYTMLGSGTRALAMARRGLLEAQQAGGAFTEALAGMRLGHAYQLVNPSDTSLAQSCYLEALKVIQQLGVQRTRAEAYMGLTLIFGHDGDLVTAESYASEGIQVAQAAGDEWTVGLLLLALGGAAVATGGDQALEWLGQAQQRFVRGGDSYGETVVLLWQALHAIRAGQAEAAGPIVARVLDLAARHGYEGVLNGPSLFGPRDMAMLVPLLLRARTLPDHAARGSHLLRSGFSTIAADDMVDTYHPGYTLRVQMLGTFRVWRGWNEIQAREWQREKARQLFQLLLTYRGNWLQREQICAWLWPDNDLEAAERQFKVTLNALNAALEPGRPARTAPFFIRRQGLAYSFAPSYGVWIDVDEFELRVAGAATQDEPDFARRNSQAAVQLYKGDYLAESLYDAWTTEERERLLARYLAAATKYATRLLEQGDYGEAIQLCERVLRRDHCYEEAYQVLMHAHARSGSRSQALRSYARCVQALHDDLGMEPLPETTALYERLKRNEGRDR